MNEARQMGIGFVSLRAVIGISTQRASLQSFG